MLETMKSVFDVTIAALREIALVAAGAFAIAAAVIWGQSLLYARTQFWLLALMPGTVGLVHFFVVTWKRYDLRRADARGRLAPGPIVHGVRWDQLDDAPLSDMDLDRFRPSFGYTLWAAIAISVVFVIPAVLASHMDDVRLMRIGGFPVYFSKELPDGLNAIMYAALGAFVSVIWRMISRIHLNALTPRFLMTSALRSAAALMIAFVTGYSDLFGVVRGEARLGLYFLVGLFTNFAMTALTKRARTAFKIDDVCADLPLCLIEGVSEHNTDQLEEFGVWTIQHLATYDPTELSLRTLLPLNRVIDWIDQAILIGYFRQNINRARELAIRGSIDFTVAYLWARDGKESPGSSGTPDSRTSAAAVKTLDLLAQKLGMTYEALWLLGSSLSYDAHVMRIYKLWQRGESAEKEEMSTL